MIYLGLIKNLNFIIIINIQIELDKYENVKYSYLLFLTINNNNVYGIIASIINVRKKTTYLFLTNENLL